MTELSFAKTFLSTLDQRPSKITPDHIEDPRSYPAQNAYILPRMPKPLSKHASPTNTTSTSPTSSPNTTTYTIHLLSTRNPPISLTLPSLPPTTSIHDLKTELSSSASIPIAKLKILWNKRPVPDSKVLKDFVSEEDGGGGGGKKGELEFGVMVMGGAASIVKREEVVVEEKERPDVEMKDVEPRMAAPAVQGPSGLEVIESVEFWSDLEGYLMQRVRDEGRSKKLVQVFKEGFENRKSEF